MTSRTVEIINERGLHARASAKFVKTASSFDAEVMVGQDGLPRAVRVLATDGFEN